MMTAKRGILRSKKMTDFNPNVLISIFAGVLTALVGFFFRREREMGQIAASLKALHRRIDRLEALANGALKNAKSID